MRFCGGRRTKRGYRLRRICWRRIRRLRSGWGFCIRIRRGWWSGGWRDLARSATIALLEANNRAPRLSCALHDVGATGRNFERIAAGGVANRGRENFADRVCGERRESRRGRKPFAAARFRFRMKLRRSVPLAAGRASGRARAGFVRGAGRKDSAAGARGRRRRDGGGGGSACAPVARDAGAIQAAGIGGRALVELDAAEALPFGVTV